MEPQSLYTYFASKAEIFDVMFREANEELLARTPPDVHDIAYVTLSQEVSVVEQAAVPQFPSLAHRALQVFRAWTTPASPSDYLELVNPLWSTRELLGSVGRSARRRQTPPPSS